MTTYAVELYVYDLSKGMAAHISPLIIGKKIDGIWHSSIVIYGREFFFGSSGVESCNPAETLLGDPVQKLKLGETQVPYSVFIDYISGLSESTYSGSAYNLFLHNCNHFTEEIAQFLLGTGIPQYILELPNEVISSSLGQAIPLLIGQLERSARPIAEERARSREHSPDLEQLNSEIDEARYKSFLLEERRKTLKEKLAKKERKREKKRKRLLKQGGPVPVDLEDIPIDMETEVNNGGAEESRVPAESVYDLEEEERLEDEAKKKARDPPIVFKDLLEAKPEFDSLLQLVDGKLTPEEQKFMEELQVYMLGDEGSWAISDGFLNFVGRLLHDREFSPEVRVRIMNLLAIAALKDDVILILHQDRKDHLLMNYVFEIDRVTPEEQQAIAIFVANMFENLSSSEWLMYISEWTFNNQQTSNIRVTTKAAVHSLLSDLTELQDRGTAIIHNLACKEVFDDVAVELTMALLQYFNAKPSEEHLFRCMKALARFTQISTQEVPQ